MRGFVFGIAVLLAGPTLADDWVPMTGDQITAALTDQRLDYGDAWQEFRASGRTLYHAGRDSWGYWAARGDQYCSQWPPGDLWACYDMERRGDVVRFVAGDGSTTEGRFAK